MYDEKRRKIRPSDEIVFTNTATGETLRTRVFKLHCFNSFGELYQTLPLLQCGYTEEDIAQAQPSDMEQYYSVDDQAKYGVVGIELFLQKQTTDETFVLLCRKAKQADRHIVVNYETQGRHMKKNK